MPRRRLVRQEPLVPSMRGAMRLGARHWDDGAAGVQGIKLAVRKVARWKPCACEAYLECPCAWHAHYVARILSARIWMALRVRHVHHDSAPDDRTVALVANLRAIQVVQARGGTGAAGTAV